MGKKLSPMRRAVSLMCGQLAVNDAAIALAKDFPAPGCLTLGDGDEETAAARMLVAACVSRGAQDENHGALHKHRFQLGESRWLLRASLMIVINESNTRLGFKACSPSNVASDDLRKTSR